MKVREWYAEEGEDGSVLHYSDEQCKRVRLYQTEIFLDNWKLVCRVF